MNNQDISEIGFSSVKLHTKIYKVIGFKRSKGKVRILIDKNFIELKELHSAAAAIVTSFPIQVRNTKKEKNIILDVLKRIKEDLDKPWDLGMMNYIPGFFLEKGTWTKRLPSMLSEREVASVRIIKKGKMYTGIHNIRIGQKSSLYCRKYEEVKTLRNFLDFFDKELNLKLLENL